MSDLVATSAASTVRRRVGLVLRPILCVAMLVFLFRQFDPRKTLDGLRALPAAHLLVGFILMGLAIFFDACTWRVLGRAQALPVTLGPLWRITLIAKFFGNLLPGSLGEDATKALLSTGRWPGQTPGLLLSCVMVRLLGLLFIVAASTVGLQHLVHLPAPVSLTWSSALLPVATLAIGASLFYFAASMLSSRVPAHWPRLRKLAEAIKSHGHFPHLLLALGAVAVNHLCVYAIFSVLSVGLQLPMPWWLPGSLAPLTILAGMVPVSLGGLGVREVAWIGLLGRLGLLLPAGGIAPESIVSLSLAFYGINLAWGAVGGILLLLGSKKG